MQENSIHELFVSLVYLFTLFFYPIKESHSQETLPRISSIAEHLVINEVYFEITQVHYDSIYADTLKLWDGWIEIYNPADVEKTLGAVSFTGYTTGNLLPLEIKNNGGIGIAPQSFLILCTDSIALKNLWTIPAGAVLVDIPELLSQGSFIRICESVVGGLTYVDELVLGDFYMGGKPIIKYARRSDGYDTNISLQDFIVPSIPTPGRTNVTIPTGIQDIAGTTPDRFALFPNYPNPFNPLTSIRYTLPQAANATLTVYDLLGRPVATLREGYQPAGMHTVQWDGCGRNGVSAASGVYLYRLQTSTGFVETRRMLMLK